MNTLTIDYTDEKFNEKFVRSLHNTGFAIIKNHLINQDLIDKVYLDWQLFFNSDKKHDFIFDYEKQDGYFPFKSENAYDSKKKDLKEFFHIYPSWGRYPNFVSKDSLILFDDLMLLGEKLLKSIDSYSPKIIKEKYSKPLYKMFANSNVTRIVASEEYVHERGRQILNEAGIKMDLMEGD